MSFPRGVFALLIFGKFWRAAPQGPFGFLRVRRNSANFPGVPQVSLWPSAAVFVCCFDPGAPQGSFGSPGSLELFSRTSVVHRGAPRGSQLPVGTQGAKRNVSEVFVEDSRPHWLAECWDPGEGLLEYSEILELVGSQPKKDQRYVGNC